MQAIVRGSVINARQYLLLTDYALIVAFWFAGFFLCDPSKSNFDRFYFTKHLPMVFTLMGLLGFALGYRLFMQDHSSQRKHLPAWPVLKSFWPLAALSVWILLGSGYAERALGIWNSFTVVGLYMLLGVGIGAYITYHPARETVIRQFIWSATIACLIMILHMVFSVAVLGTYFLSYHELEAYFIPLAIYFLIRQSPESARRDTCLALCFLGGAFLFKKNTAYIVLMVTLVYLWFIDWRYRFQTSAVFRMFFSIAAGAGAALIGVVWLLVRQGAEILPSGNPQYRLLTYEAAWTKFLNSPIYGTSFTGSATERFKAFDISAAGGVLPTHSDVLDLLAHGGVLAIGLLVVFYLFVVHGIWAVRKQLADNPEAKAIVHVLSSMTLCSVWVYAFNPLMLQPVKAFILWGQLGLLQGYLIYLRRVSFRERAGK